MANEITITSTLKYAKNKAAASLTGSVTVNQTGDKYEAGVQIIGTAEESISKNDIGTIGYCMFRNMDASNYVTIGAVSGPTNHTLTVKAGEVAGPLRWTGTGIFAKADTAPVNLEYLLIED